MNEREQNVIEAFLEKHDQFTYPAELEKLSRKGITRAGAISVCQRLAEQGWLEMKEMCSPNHSRKTPHYRLKINAGTLAKFTKEYFQALMKDDPHSWQGHAEINFMGSEFARSMITGNLVRQILASKKIRVTHAVPMTENSDKNNIRRHWTVICPIRPPNLDISQMISKTYEIFSPDTPYGDESAIRQYYDHIEEKEIILPILSLILISPTALGYFLSDWKPYRMEDWSPSGINEIEHVIFRLIWNAINDLAITRNIPKNETVMDAIVSTDSLLEIILQGGDRIQYNASFDTFRTYYGCGTDVYEIEINPENCTVQIIWKAWQVKRAQSSNLVSTSTK